MPDFERTPEQLRLALVGAAGDAAVRATTEIAVHPVRRETPTDRVDGIPVGRALTLGDADVALVRAALTDPATWRWDVSTRHRPLADTLFVLQGAVGRVLVGLDRRGGKLGVVKGGRLEVADIAPGSPGVGALVRFAERADAEERG